MILWYFVAVGEWFRTVKVNKYLFITKGLGFYVIIKSTLYILRHFTFYDLMCNGFI